MNNSMKAENNSSSGPENTMCQSKWQMATELKLHVIKHLHLKQVAAPPEVTGGRRRLAKGFCHNNNGDQKYPLACPAFEEWDVTKAMQEMCHSIWDTDWKGIYCAHVKHILHKVGGDRHGERVDRIEDSPPHLGGDEPGAEGHTSYKLMILVTKCV